MQTYLKRTGVLCGSIHFCFTRSVPTDCENFEFWLWFIMQVICSHPLFRKRRVHSCQDLIPILKSLPIRSRKNKKSSEQTLINHFSSEICDLVIHEARRRKKLRQASSHGPYFDLTLHREKQIEKNKRERKLHQMTNKCNKTSRRRELYKSRSPHSTREREKG